jgi:transposase
MQAIVITTIKVVNLASIPTKIPTEFARQARRQAHRRSGSAPHLTLLKLKDELAARGVNVSHNAVWMFPRREGLRFKKNVGRH